MIAIFSEYQHISDPPDIVRNNLHDFLRILSDPYCAPEQCNECILNSESGAGKIHILKAEYSRKHIKSNLFEPW